MNILKLLESPGYALIFAVSAWSIILALFALTIALPNKTKVAPGSRGHRQAEDDTGNEEIRPDGYIDSFNGVIEEAGGGLPLVVKIAFPGILLWYLFYLILNWA